MRSDVEEFMEAMRSYKSFLEAQAAIMQRAEDVKAFGKVCYLAGLASNMYLYDDLMQDAERLAKWWRNRVKDGYATVPGSLSLSHHLTTVW